MPAPNLRSASTPRGVHGILPHQFPVQPSLRVTAATDTDGEANGSGLQRIAAALRRAESLWEQNRTAVAGTIVALHDGDDVDEALIPCFMFASLPQTATDFIELAGMMQPRQPLFAVYLPTAKRSAASAITLDSLAQYYANAIDTAYPTGPVALGGWSAGATIALAVAKYLRERDHEVPLLAAIDGAPPAVDGGPRPVRDKIRLTWYRLLNATVTLARFGGDLARRVWHRSPEHATLPGTVRAAWQDSAFRPIWLRAVAPVTGRATPGGTTSRRHPVEVCGDIAHLPPEHQAFAMALYDAIDDYVPAREHKARVVVFESTAEPARSSSDVARKWRRLATNLQVVAVSGTHMSIVAWPDGLPLADELCRQLRLASQPQRQTIQ